ncbi:COX aromatic rich motif-containing protein [Paenibacillus sp. JX-17]|uniref:Quinol oxidase subunit 2 n=1 Tax=Paenibacillus lacisoli TaxID=3064525 RepID=A0ABT9CH23_9BACL|nr:COX aromatic rich motif-containing protein [Paenibacillus sp. JX-17]MDO7907883.1 COX aromatic rich motif-containing protein [Paenibacillus sp. JX-17]
MNKKTKMLLALVLTVLTVGLLIWTCFFTDARYVVFDTSGPVAKAQSDLIIITTLLCAIIIVPVLILTGVIVWRYRDRPDSKAGYQPKWEHSNKLETIWWGIPIVVIIVIAVVTANYTYALEPSNSQSVAKAASTSSSEKAQQKPINIQVTSLDWKWLFMYPDEGIATVNQIVIPEGVPVHFELTSDAPMNSFWVPELGGQVYTMSGMAMQLYLQADKVGTYYGSGANFSGEHFAQMRFTVDAKSQQDYEAWVADVKNGNNPLTKEGYEALAQPSPSQPEKYSSFPEGLFKDIVTKYVVKASEKGHEHGESTGTEVENGGDKTSDLEDGDHSSDSH